MPEISGIHHVSVTVTDIETSVPWYAELLGLTKLMEEKHLTPAHALHPAGGHSGR
jgi:catechol 2,3-dioxygenase-like lactoylglutathione lyase family enzyme